MDKIDVDGTPFSVLMDRAVKLKSKQVGEERRNYDKMPSFYQHSIFPHEDVLAARSLDDFNARLAAALELKDKGNSAFKECRFADALSQYEKAIAVFRYLENSNPEWRTQGIKDDFIREVAYECHNEIQKSQLGSFLQSCYKNIALSCYKMKDYRLSIMACDSSLEIDDRCDKSYFIRAKSRITPPSSGALEQEAAVSDLKLAIELNPKNNEARKLLQTTKAKAKSQRIRDKQSFSGLFDRGEVYDAKAIAEAKLLQAKSKEVEETIAKERDATLGRQLLQHYEEKGMETEKAKLEKSLNANIQQQKGAPDLISVDFRNPSNKMIDDAKSMGVDLTDPLTIELLEHMQKNDGKLSDDAVQNTCKAKQSTNYFRIIGYVMVLMLWGLSVRYMMKSGYASTFQLE